MEIGEHLRIEAIESVNKERVAPSDNALGSGGSFSNKSKVHA